MNNNDPRNVWPCRPEDIRATRIHVVDESTSRAPAEDRTIRIVTTIGSIVVFAGLIAIACAVISIIADRTEVVADEISVERGR